MLLKSRIKITAYHHLITLSFDMDSLNQHFFPPLSLYIVMLQVFGLDQDLILLLVTKKDLKLVILNDWLHDMLVHYLERVLVVGNFLEFQILWASSLLRSCTWLPFATG